MKKISLLTIAGVVAMSSSAMANHDFVTTVPEAGQWTSISEYEFMTKDTETYTVDNIHMLTEDIRYGINDKLSVHGVIKYVYNPDEYDRLSDGRIDKTKKGAARGHIGLRYKFMDEAQDILTSRLKFDLHLGGSKISETDVAFGPMSNPAVDSAYVKNYSRGAYGVNIGPEFVKTFGNLTLGARAELQYRMPTDNNSQNVDLQERWDYELGLQAAYKINEKWDTLFSITRINYDDVKVDQTFNAAYYNALAGGLAGTVYAPGTLNKGDDFLNRYVTTEYRAQLNYALTKDTKVGLFYEYEHDTTVGETSPDVDYKSSVGVSLISKF